MANNQSTKKKFCSFCGRQLKVTAKFCSECGCAVVDDSNEDENLRIDDALQEVEKTVDELAGTTTQKTSDWKSKSAKTLDSIDDFETRYNKAKKDEAKIAAVNSFKLPKSSSEMMQLVTLCAENISKTGVNSYDVETAWMGKLDQAYQRARLTMNEDPLFSGIESIFLEKSQEYREKNGKARRLGSWIKRHKGVVAFVCYFGGLLLIAAICFWLSDSDNSNSKSVKEFNEAVDRVTQEIEEGKLETAYNDALKLKPQGSDQKRTRQSLLDRIAQLRGSVDGKLFFPILSDGIDYKDAITKLERAGFTNISAEAASKKDGMEKYIQKAEKWAGELKEGNVIEISVNGDVEYLDDFDHDNAIMIMGTYVDPDAKIVLRYYEK